MEEVATERSVDLVKRDEWRLAATPGGFAVVLEAGGLVYSFPIERARAASILSFFTNAEYTMQPCNDLCVACEQRAGRSEEGYVWMRTDTQPWDYTCPTCGAHWDKYPDIPF